MNARERVAPVASQILEMAPEVEASRQLPRALVEALADAGLLSIYTPAEFGGLGLPLPEALRVVEEVSRLDGSTGWTVALGFGSPLFTAILGEEQARAIFRDPATIIAGAPAFSVQAVPVEGGYRLSGRWPFNSGAPNAGWVALATPIFEGGAPRMGPTGPEMIMAFLPIADVEILDTWHVTGLRGSGTQDLRVDDVFVPAEFSGPFAMPHGPMAKRPGVLSRIPFVSMLAIGQAPPVCLGIARRAVDEFRTLILQKERPFGPRPSEQAQAQAGLARAEALVESARSYWYQNVDALWESATTATEIAMETRVQTRLASLTAAENSVAAVNLLFRLSGTSAIYNACPLERCWRDVHTAAQHMQVQDGRWEDAGRVLLGLEPGTPFV